MVRACFPLFCLFLGAMAPLAIAAPGDSPSMNPESLSLEKKDPLGLGTGGKERPKEAKTEITATKEANFDNVNNIAEFEGNVVVKDVQFTLFCDKLKVTLGKDNKGMEQAEAIGKVTIVQESKDENGKMLKSTGRAGKAIYTPKSGDIVLTTWPSVQRDINMQVSTEEGTIMTLNRNGKSKTVGGSKTVIVDTGGESSRP